METEATTATEKSLIAAHILNIYGDTYCPISQVSRATNQRDGVIACACCGTVLSL